MHLFSFCLCIIFVVVYKGYNFLSLLIKSAVMRSLSLDKYTELASVSKISYNRI